MKATYKLTLFFTLLLSTVSIFVTAKGQALEDNIKLALILAKTGPGKTSDYPGVLSALLAVEEINQQGGVLGKEIELIVLDSQSTPIGALKAAKQAVEEDVLGVIGASWSSQSLPIAKFFQKAHIPMISPSSTHPDITKEGDYIFRVCFNDYFQGTTLARFARQDLGASSAVIFRNVSEFYSTNLAETFKNSFSAMGGEILWQGNYKTHTSDFSDILHKVETLNPDIIFLPGYERDSGIIMRQAASLGIHTRFLGGDGWGEIMTTFSGDAANGAFFLAQWHHESPNTDSQELVRVYRARYPEADYTSIMVPLSYDAIYIMVNAIKRAGTKDREAIRKALSQTMNYNGITGEITFNADGDPQAGTAAMLKFEGTETQFYKPVSYP